MNIISYKPNHSVTITYGLQKICIKWRTNYATGKIDHITGIEIGFLDGNEEPELFVQDNPTSGSVFTNDQITYKIRHIYGGAVIDYRAFQGSVVTQG